nr:hypothetical protein [Tanacetum cinerariifolium]
SRMCILAGKGSGVMGEVKGDVEKSWEVE